MRNKKQNIEKVFEFLSEEIEIGSFDLTMDTSINYDLGIDGDEAIDFFQKFEKEFHLDLDTFFEKDYDKYFGSEGANPFTILLSFFKQSKKLEKFTVKMLIDLYEENEST